MNADEKDVRMMFALVFRYGDPVLLGCFFLRYGFVL